jgi:hypothetical protein
LQIKKTDYFVKMCSQKHFIRLNLLLKALYAFIFNPFTIPEIPTGNNSDMISISSPRFWASWRARAKSGSGSLSKISQA